MIYNAAMFLLLGLLSGMNVGITLVVIAKEWIFIRNVQRLRYITLVLYSLTLLVAALVRGVGQEPFLPRYFLAMTSVVVGAIAGIWTLIDIRGRSADTKLALRRLEQRQTQP